MHFLTLAKSIMNRTICEHADEGMSIKQFCSPSKTAYYPDGLMKVDSAFGARKRRQRAMND